MDTTARAEMATSPVKTTSTQDEETRKRGQSLSDRTINSKKLSLNFPVLLPQHANGPASQSPNTSTPLSPARSSPRSATSAIVETPEFLTLLAGQERKVLELREELGKAENELLALKKQWANLEASKKKSELRQIAKLQPLPPSSGKDDSENERERQRILEQTTGKPRRHTSQRVFSSSRHARQLSLLSPTSVGKQTIRTSLDESVSSSQNDPGIRPTLEHADPIPKPSVESPKNLGKTYKQLANRHSLPPPSTDVIMRQGKQMANDLRDGLWTFFEDIRQATVGEEAVNGIQGENGRPKMAKRNSNTLHRKKRFSKENPHMHQEDAGAEPNKEPSFWREFGVDTPQKDGLPHRQVSDPLLDLDDEAWEAWESPQQKQTEPPASTAGARQDGGLPWPELRKSLTPGRLTRTVSDMMKEWETDPGTVVDHRSPEAQAGQDRHLWTSPHI